MKRYYARLLVLGRETRCHPSYFLLSRPLSSLCCVSTVWLYSDDALPRFECPDQSSLEALQRLCVSLLLSLACTRHAPWLAYSFKALSNLNCLKSGLSLSLQDISAAPLRNSRLLTAEDRTITCCYFINRSVLCVCDLLDSDYWTVLLQRSSCGPRKLRSDLWEKLRTVLRSLARAWESRLLVSGPSGLLNFEQGLRLSPLY